jgi:hypothetical protein
MIFGKLAGLGKAYVRMAGNTGLPPPNLSEQQATCFPLDVESSALDKNMF